jgi:replicative DNA helicase
VKLGEHIALEKLLIADLIMLPAYVPNIQEFVFLSELHRNVFRAMKRQYMENPGRGIDLAALAYDLGKMPGEIYGMFPEPSYSAQRTIQAVYCNWIKREQGGAVRDSENAIDALEGLIKLKHDLEEIHQRLQLRGEDKTKTQFEEDVERGSRIFKTYIPSLDHWFGGFEESELVYIAARPGQGKTAFGTSLALSMAAHGVPVDFFTLEMQGKRVRRRIIANMASVEIRKIKHRHFTPEERQRCLEKNEELSQRPLNIYAAAGKNADEMLNAILSSRADVVIVDYIGCIRPSIDGTKAQQVGDVSNKLNSAAKKSGKVVIALVQMNRDSARDNRRPGLTDLRDSGELEQDADNVIFLFEPDRERNIQADRHVVQIDFMLEKARDGETGYKKIYFDKRFARFYDLEEQPLAIVPTF